MKKITILLALALVVALTLPAAAEVEEVTVGGSIQVRGQFLVPGLDGGFWSVDDDINENDWITQRTRINVDAKLSGNVRGFVELQSYDFWGLDVDDIEIGAIDPVIPGRFGIPFPEEKNYGIFAGQGNDNINLYQAYIEMNEVGDYPLQIRIGRQELAYGREWLVGNNDAGNNFAGLSFDAVKLSYDDEMLSVDAWWSKLVDLSSPIGSLIFGEVEVDADMDFYGIYGTYKGVENMTIDAYYLLVRNGFGTSLGGAVLPPFIGTEVDMLHTIGARVAGGMDLQAGMLDYNVEGAYQFGDNHLDEDYSAWAFNAMAGFQFADVAMSPRVEAEYAYFSGDDDAGDGDTEEFVRLFSDVHYGALNLGGNLDAAASNLHIFRFGASAVPVEKLTVSADLLYFLLAEDDDDGGGKTFGMPQFGDPDDTVGIELDLAAAYQYTEDLNLRAGWAHLFVDDAMEQSWGFDSDDDDIDYLYVEAELTF